MRKFSVLVLCCLTLGSIAQKQKAATDKRFEGLDTAFARVLKDWKAAGFAVAVVEKDKVVYANGFGYRDIDKKLPVTANTLFAIGSCTKAFTSSVLGLLNKDGKVDYDKPVRDYLPELKFYNDEMNNTIKLRDLMSHRTGLPRYDYSWYMFGSNSADSLIQRIKYMEPTYGVREKWQYNNFMFMVQGVVAEKLTHKSWEQNVKQQLFAPLGMVRSNFSVDSMALDSDAALGYDVKKDSIIYKTDYFHIQAMEAAGAINSSVNEMANWVITWINGGKFKGTEILPSGYVAEAMSPQMIVGAGLPGKENPDLFFSTYGFGWMQSSYKGHLRVEHGGNIDGFSANTCFFPSDSVGIIVLTNQNGSSIPSVVRNIIADRMLNVRKTDWETYLKGLADKQKATAGAVKDTTAKKPVIPPTHALKDYAGLYHNDAFGTFEVVNERDSLFLLLPLHTWWLKPFAFDIFEVYEKDKKEGIDTSDVDQLKPQFLMNKAGEINGIQLALEPGVKPITFDKKAKPKAITKEELQVYVGEYELGGAVVKTYIKGDNTLFVLVPGQPEYELVPVEKNKFAIKVAEGYYVLFIVNDKNETTELSFVQPNGTFNAKRKK
jgi:CubicO group peptidase (beta-lactamase class C family)